MDSSLMEPSRHVKSTAPPPVDLAHFCLEPDPAESKRVLAWVNSVCLVFLMIGCIGLGPSIPNITRRPPPPEEAVPTVIEPLTTEIQTITADGAGGGDSGEAAPADNTPAVAVTLDSPAVVFPVPTVGNVLVPLDVAPAPPPHPMQSVAPLSSAPRMERIGVTGVDGSRPPPPYPDDSLQRKEQGRVLLALEVDESGKITSIFVKESSGYPALDRSTLDYVRRHWYFAPAVGRRQYEAPIIFRISPN